MCYTCRTNHPNGWGCPEHIKVLEAKVKVAIEVIYDARWFIAIGCFTGDCPHPYASDCVEAIKVEAERLGEHLQAAIDKANG